MLANRESSKFRDFEPHLLWYMNIVAPLIRSLWSLEAAHANASDVFVFWLAAGATLNDLFSKDTNETGIPLTLANQVTEIYSKMTCILSPSFLIHVSFFFSLYVHAAVFIKGDKIQ